MSYEQYAFSVLNINEYPLIKPTTDYINPTGAIKVAKIKLPITQLKPEVLSFFTDAGISIRDGNPITIISYDATQPGFGSNTANGTAYVDGNTWGVTNACRSGFICWLYPSGTGVQYWRIGGNFHHPVEGSSDDTLYTDLIEKWEDCKTYGHPFLLNGGYPHHLTHESSTTRVVKITLDLDIGETYPTASVKLQDKKLDLSLWNVNPS
jgi:hypothetical protein